MAYTELWYRLKRDLLKETKGEKFEVGADNATKLLILMSEIEVNAALEGEED